MNRLYAQDLAVEDFLDTVRTAAWPADSLLLAFSPAQARFEPFRFDRDFLRTSEQGRIFGPTGEFKWRRLDGRFRVVYLGEDLPSLQLEEHPQMLAGLEQDLSQQLILWGKRTNLANEWIEQQVPQRFAYHITGQEFPKGRVALVIERWLDDLEMPKFSRYHSLIEIPGEDHASR